MVPLVPALQQQDLTHLALALIPELTSGNTVMAVPMGLVIPRDWIFGHFFPVRPVKLQSKSLIDRRGM